MKKLSLQFPASRLYILLGFVITLTINIQLAQAQTGSIDLNTESAEESADEGHSIAHKIILYIPNRLFDLFDIFRARIEVGPGIAAGVRATEIAQVYAGTHASVYAGLPGPRGSATIPLPAGLESYNGVALGPVDATANMSIGPEYSSTEIGATVHPFIFGIDFGIDPVEIADFAVGILGFDLRDDDL